MFLGLVSLFLLTACTYQNSEVQKTESGEDTSVTAQKTEETQGTSEESGKITVSRDPAEGCTWEMFDASAIKLKFSVQKCKDAASYGDIALKVEGNAVVQYLQGKKAYEAIEVFQKKASEQPEVALRKQFISKLTQKEQRGCWVTKEDPKRVGSSVKAGQSIYTIDPIPEYVKELETQQEGPMSACGDYGLTNGIQYFLFQDSNPEMFVFVRVGQDAPLFDEQNIEFLK